jgi:O-antigen/teichoic acid export membrane protein
MQRKFVVNLALLLFLNLLVKPFYILGIDAEVQNQVGAHEYGMYFSIFSFSFLFNILLDLGITNFNTRNIAQNEQLLSKHFSGILSLKFVLVGFYFLFSFIIGFIIGYDQLQLKMLLILLINQSIVSMILYFRSNLAGLHLFKQDSFISVLDRLLLIVFMSVLLWGGITDQALKIEWFILVQTGSYAITAIVAYAIVRKRSSLKRLKLKGTFSLMILKKSVPFALLVLMMTFYYRIDSVMLERMLPNGSEQTGIYAMGYRFFEASNNISYLFAVLLLPIFSRMIKNNEKVDQLVVLAFRILISSAIFLALLSLFYGKEILSLRYVLHIEEATAPFQLLMFCFIAIASNYIFGTLLTANGSLTALNIIAFSGMVMNIVLNLILIPKYQVFGSALASLITQVFTSLVQFFIAVKVFSFKVNTKLIAQFSFFIVVLYASMYYMQGTELGIIVQVGIAIVLFIMLVIFTGIFNLKSLRSLLKQE